MLNQIKTQHYYFENLTDSRDLDEGYLEIWLFSYEAVRVYYNQCLQYLSLTEKDRVLGYQNIEDKEKAVLRWGLLRLLLSNYLNRDAQDIQISYEGYGKPYLHNENINFSLSHSHKLLAYSFSKMGLLGLDIEAIQYLEDILDVSTLIFSQQEQAQLKQLVVGGHQKAFFNGWTRKEAYGKAIGKGLHQGLKEVTILLDDIDEGSCLSVRKNNVDLDIVIYPFTPADGYVAAIASNTTIKEIRFCKLRQ